MNTFAVVLLTLLAGVLVGVATNMISEKAKEHSSFPVIAGLIAAAFVALVLVQINGAPTSSTGELTPQPPGTETPQPSNSPPTTNPPSTPPATPTPAQPPVQATSILDLPVTDQETNSLIDLEETDASSINGTAYARTLRYECNLYCNGSSPQVFEVTLGKKFSTFTTSLGVLDTKNGEHRIDISLDQGDPVIYTANPGPPTEITLDVKEVSRMTIRLYAPNELKSPLQAGVDSTIGENGGDLPGVALADPVVLP
ncbi:hypothetical protein [uncultured Arthrobacter sp.]|uniref:hypothetical protein n=1 Tax=uncultured Arthrobacter sp. TaxID=114050 RepID=UPI00262A1C15|nr:hypothetical protein [uncultured Arthrobacter sp.]